MAIVNSMTETVLIFLFSQAVAFIGLMIAIYIRVTTKHRELEIRVTIVEKQDNTIIEKLEEINEQITNMRIEIQNKKNRDN